MPEKLDDSQEIKVSVCVVTYNQEKYIAECLQSLLSQETTFKYEIIVGEDCSTDRTRNIIEELHKKNPDLIVRNFHSENVGAVANIVSTYEMAKGKYICHMDGDDYALLGKLQSQYEALEANPDCVICSHDVIVVDSAGRKIRDSFKQHKKEKNTLIDLLDTLPFFAHSSKMFRSISYGSLWEELDPQAIDIEVHAAQAKHGKILHIDNTLGAYRSSTGISTKTAGVNPVLEKGTDRLFKKILLETPKEKERILMQYAKSKYRYAYQSSVMGNNPETQRLASESIKIKIFSAEQVFFYLISKTPTLLNFLCRARARTRGYKIN